MVKIKRRHLLFITVGLIFICCFAFSGIAEAAKGALTIQYKNI